MLSSKKLLLLSVLLASFALPGCGKKEGHKHASKSKVERVEKKHKRSKKTHVKKHVKKSRSKKHSKKDKSKKSHSKKGLLSKSY